MSVPFQFDLNDMDIQPRSPRCMIYRQPLKFEIRPQFQFSFRTVAMSLPTGAVHFKPNSDMQQENTIHPPPTPIHYHQALDTESFRKYTWDKPPSITSSPPSSPPRSPSPNTIPSLPTLTDHEIRESLLNILSYRRYIHEEEYVNPHGEDWNVGWLRWRSWFSKTAAICRDNWPLSEGGVVLKRDIQESFQRFSFTSQRHALQFDEKSLKDAGFGFVFKGEHMSGCGQKTCHQRTPGQWWAARKRLMECCRGVRFLTDNELQVGALADKLMNWHENGRGGTKVLDVQNKTASAEWYLLEVENSWIIPGIHARCDRGSNLGWLKWRYGAGDGSGNTAIKRTAAARGVFEKRYDWKFCKTKRAVESQKIMSEEWRARRRAQEKKAGRWTDGTLLMDQMWTEIPWVSDFHDPRDGPFPDSLTAEEAEEEEGKEEGKEEEEREWHRRRNRWGFLASLTGKMAEEDEVEEGEEEEERGRRRERNKWRK